MSTPKRRRWLVLALTLLTVALLFSPARDLIQALRLAWAIRSLASGSTGEELAVSQTKVSRVAGDENLEALVYRHHRAPPRRAAILVAGVSELGCYHPRLVALARSLANQGFLVLTPDIRMFREFRVTPASVDQIHFWFRQLRSIEGAERVERAGLIGISFSGTLALIAASRADIRDSVAYVMGIGAYDDLLRCSRRWFETSAVTVSEGYYPTRFYGKWIIMMAALNLVTDERERAYLHEVLWNLLLQKPLPRAGSPLSHQAERWHQFALMREDQTDAELVKAIEEYLKPILYEALSPTRAAREVRCPVFLAHGAHDDLIPSEESIHLRGRISSAPTHLLISPFLTHTHPLEKQIGWRQKNAGLVDLVGFLYHLARACG